MDGPDEDDIEAEIDTVDAEGDAGAAQVLRVALGEAEAGARLDKALADRAEGLSRARLQALIEAGAVRFMGAGEGGAPVRSGSAKARAGEVQ